MHILEAVYVQTPGLPLSKGGKTPLFGKEGLGEIFRCMSIRF